MASANVELVRSIFAAWERGDFSSADWADPEIEYVWADGPTPSTWKGFDEMAEAERQFLSGMWEFRVEAEEYRELDNDHVPVFTRVSGRGKESGLEFGQLMRTAGAVLFLVRKGR